MVNQLKKRLKYMDFKDLSKIYSLIDEYKALQKTNKVYTIEELENVLQTHDLDKIEDYFNQFSYLKTQRRDVIELLKQYINNETKLNVIVEYGNKYKGEHLHFLLEMCKIHS